MWFKEMLSGASGEVSSKRTILFLFVLLFIGLVISNHVTGKNVDEIFKQQLFYLIGTCLLLVFGEKALTAWAAIKGSVKIDKTESTVSTTEVTTKTEP